MPPKAKRPISDEDLIAAARRSERRESTPPTVDPANAGPVSAPVVATAPVPIVGPQAEALSAAGVVEDTSDNQIGNLAGELAPHLVPIAADRDFSAPTIDVVADSLAAMGVMDEEAPYLRRGPALDAWSHREAANAVAQANVPRTEVEAESLARSAAMIGRMAQQVNVRDPDRATRGPSPVDALTQRVNEFGLDVGRVRAPYYREYAIFDYFKDRSGFRCKFSRWYPAQRLLVDFYARPSVAIDEEVAEKIRQILAFNEHAADNEKMGYLSAFAGDVISDNSLVAALHGEVFALPLRVPTNAPW